MKAYLQVRCSKSQLAAIRDFAREQLAQMQVGEPVSHQIVLAIDEACANCMIHQHQCDGYSVLEVSMYRKGDVVYAEIRDSGQGFPIDRYQPEDVRRIVQRRGKGGLGINLIHHIMDEIQVEQGEDYYVYKLGKRVTDAQAPRPSTSP
jgi:serine/threonine-protein kinase RsbW